MTVTARGWGTAGGVVVLFVVGLVLGYPELALLGSVGLAALVIAALWMVRRPRLHVDRTLGQLRVTRGGPAYGELRVTNAGLVRTAGVTVKEWRGDRWRSVDIRSLRRGEVQTTRYRLPTQRRGVFAIGPLRLTRADPFGFLRREEEQGGVEDLWVRPVVHLGTTLPIGARRSLDGPDVDRAPHGSITFDRLRDWVTGDDPRHIDWRATARTGTPIVREFVDTTLPRLVVVLDERVGKATDEQYESAVEVAATMAVLALRARFPVLLVGTAGTKAKGARAADEDLVLDALTRSVRGGTDASQADALAQALREGTGSSLIVVAGALDVGDLDPFLATRRRFRSTTVVLVGDRAAAVPAVPDVRWLRVDTAADLAQDAARTDRAS